MHDASNSSTVVDHSPHQHKVKSLGLTTAYGTKKEDSKDSKFSKLDRDIQSYITIITGNQTT
jgi:hypothetical protein